MSMMIQKSIGSLERRSITFRRTVAEEFAKAIISAKVPIVPQIVSGGTSGGASIVDAMASMLMQKMATDK